MTYEEAKVEAARIRALTQHERSLLYEAMSELVCMRCFGDDVQRCYCDYDSRSGMCVCEDE